MAQVEKLDAFADLAVIDKYAQRFGKFPREVMKERFDDVMPFLLLWKEQREFQERYSRIKKTMSQTES